MLVRAMNIKNSSSKWIYQPHFWTLQFQSVQHGGLMQVSTLFMQTLAAKDSTVIFVVASPIWIKDETLHASETYPRRSKAFNLSTISLNHAAAYVQAKYRSMHEGGPLRVQVF